MTTDPHGFDYDVIDDGARSSSPGFVLDAVRRRPLGRRMLSLLTALLFVGGVTLFAYPFFTDVYTEQYIQNQLEDEFASITVSTIEEYQAEVSGQQGRALTRIALPAIGVETLVVEGTSPAALRAGAGHYPNTPLPGQVGNVAIAGHRTTYGRPFNRVDELRPGDEVWLSTPVGDYLYVVSEAPPGWNSNPFITNPQDWRVIDQTSDSLLTLTSCHPKGSAAQRIIVRAELVESFPPNHYVENVRDA